MPLPSISAPTTGCISPVNWSNATASLAKSCSLHVRPLPPPTGGSFVSHALQILFGSTLAGFLVRVLVVALILLALFLIKKFSGDGNSNGNMAREA